MRSVLPALLLVSTLTATAMQDDAMRSTSEGVYTEDQARRGRKVYDDACLRCHPAEQFKGKYLDIWAGNTVGAMYELIADTMPEGRPGKLKPREYADILAYIFRLNKLPEGPDELTGDGEKLRRIVIERRHE